MGYYIRAFCTEGEPPSIGSLIEYAGHRGSNVWLDADIGSSAGDGATWDQVGLRYKEGRLPILLELNRADGPQSLAAEEIDEFIELLEEAADRPHHGRVVEHLRRTRFVAAAQLATEDMDDDGFNAVGDVLTYFVEHNGGMMQADGEGFYDGDTVIVEQD